MTLFLIAFFFAESVYASGTIIPPPPPPPPPNSVSEIGSSDELQCGVDEKLEAGKCLPKKEGGDRGGE